MEIILMSKVENLGDLGDIVNVRSGYARNYLLPYGKAQMATDENIAELQLRKAKLEEELQKERAEAQAEADKINGNILEVSVSNVNEEGELPGSIGTSDIINGVKNVCGVEIERSQVRLPDGVFRKIGEYDVNIHLHADVDAYIKLKILNKDQVGKNNTEVDGNSTSN